MADTEDATATVLPSDPAHLEPTPSILALVSTTSEAPPVEQPIESTSNVEQKSPPPDSRPPSPQIFPVIAQSEPSNLPDVSKVISDPHPTDAGASPAPLTDALNQSSERQLNVTDALSYLDSVKMQFQDDPEVYNHFLDIMKEFKSQRIDTPGVIQRVSNLFHGHLSLIQGFNTFLPAGYRIECTTDNLDPNYITVTTPAGTTTQATNGPFKLGGSGTLRVNSMQGLNAALESIESFPSAQITDVDLSPALSYVQKIRTRYANEPEVYRKFLEILSETSGMPPNDVRSQEQWSIAFLSARYPQGEVVRRVGELLKDAPDLMKDFVEFLPDKEMQMVELSRLAELEEIRKVATPVNDSRSSKRKAEGASTAASGSTLPQKRKRKPVEREKDKEASKTTGNKAKKAKIQSAVNEVPSPSFTQRQAAVPSSPRRSAHAHPSQAHTHHVQPVPLPAPIPVTATQSSGPQPADDTQFFDRVKRALDNRETYNEFLKLVNLFTQDIIDTARLVRESRSFLGDGELMAQFKDILGWDERKERYISAEDVWTRPMGVLDRPTRDQLHVRYGSYRKLPASEVNVTCSGRDEMCKSVLNDEWVSQPTFASEDSGFLAHKKNIYEEALHRSEEERHEYDFHIEAVHRTIQMLEPLNNKIAQLSPEERNNFKLKPNLGGAGKSIHQRVIKKIYGREAGVEVYQAMQDVPAAAIPVVLTRLKQKHEEWKRAQREWNKVWREVDARNYCKSLDHQAITFRAADKKAITQKAFVNQIETARDEQMAKRASLIDPLFARTRPRHQVEFVVEDVSVLQDALKLTLSFLDRTQGHIVLADRKKIETFLRSFVPLFFMLDPVAFNVVFVPHHETVDSDMELESLADESEGLSANGSSRSGRSHRKGGGASSSGDLRKRLLKSEQAKSSRRTRAQEAASPSGSRFASPALSDVMQVDGDDGRSENGAPNGQASSNATEKSSTRRRGSFFTNTTFYVMFRLLELLYSRLHLFKTVAAELAGTSSASSKVAGPSPASCNPSAVHYYDLMLESCEKLFDNELEIHVFEEQMRSMFGMKHGYKMFTIDKVIGALIKQVQNILSDPKSQELFDILRREREIPSPSTQDLINCRKNTERVLGPDENLFRMDWLHDSKTVTVQLIGKDDSSFDDSEVLTGRWQAYIESFVSHHYTAGVPTSSTIRRPFLRRTKIPAASGGMPEIVGRGGLEIKVCVRTYRLFFVSNTEDFMFRLSTSEERTAARRALAARNAQRKKWIEKLNSAEASTDSAPVPPPSDVEAAGTAASS